MNSNIKNEKIKRRYFNWLEEAKGMAEKTIDCMVRAISLYEEFSQFEDFSKFNECKARNFKNWLLNSKNKGRSLSKTSIYHHLRHLKNFFEWLSIQPGYKSKIAVDHISYLSLDKKTVAEITNRKQAPYPSLEYVVKLCDSMVIRTEIDQRDRALIAFLLLSGMRDLAVASLPVGCFNPNTLTVIQDPSLGVKTKFSKYIQTTLMQFDETLVSYILDWAHFLITKKLFANTNPLFPRNKVEQIEGGLTFTSKEVEPAFWKTAGPIMSILKERTKVAGLEYYPPHSYRHAAIHLALSRCTTAQEIRAISQNFGHENIGTTLMTYGMLDDRQVGETVRAIDFSNDNTSGLTSNEIEEMIHKLQKMKNKGGLK